MDERALSHLFNDDALFDAFMAPYMDSVRGVVGVYEKARSMYWALTHAGQRDVSAEARTASSLALQRRVMRVYAAHCRLPLTRRAPYNRSTHANDVSVFAFAYDAQRTRQFVVVAHMVLELRVDGRVAFYGINSAACAAACASLDDVERLETDGGCAALLYTRTQGVHCVFVHSGARVRIQKPNVPDLDFYSTEAWNSYKGDIFFHSRTEQKRYNSTLMDTGKLTFPEFSSWNSITSMRVLLVVPRYGKTTSVSALMPSLDAERRWTRAALASTRVSPTGAVWHDATTDRYWWFTGSTGEANVVALDSRDKLAATQDNGAVYFRSKGSINYVYSPLASHVARLDNHTIVAERVTHFAGNNKLGVYVQNNGESTRFLYGTFSHGDLLDVQSTYATEEVIGGLTLDGCAFVTRNGEIHVHRECVDVAGDFLRLVHGGGMAFVAANGDVLLYHATYAAIRRIEGCDALRVYVYDDDVYVVTHRRGILRAHFSTLAVEPLRGTDAAAVYVDVRLTAHATFLHRMDGAIVHGATSDVVVSPIVYQFMFAYYDAIGVVFLGDGRVYTANVRTAPRVAVDIRRLPPFTITVTAKGDALFLIPYFHRVGVYHSDNHALLMHPGRQHGTVSVSTALFNEPTAWVDDVSNTARTADLRRAGFTETDVSVTGTLRITVKE